MEEEIKSEGEVSVEKTKDEVVKTMNDLLNLNEIAELINSNEKIFEIDGITYRIKRPTYKQKQEIYKKKIEKYTEMLKNEKYLLEKDLKELYLKRGIDVNAIETNMKNKVRRRDDFMIKLGGEIKNNANDETLGILKKEITELNTTIQELSIEKSNLLEFSIEQQLLIYVYNFLPFLLAEKKDGDNWIKVWNTFPEYENGNQDLIAKFSYYISMMIGSESL